MTKKKKKKIRASVSLWHGSLRELIHINIAAILESIALNLGRGSYANSLTNDYKTEDSYTDATMALTSYKIIFKIINKVIIMIAQILSIL